MKLMIRKMTDQDLELLCVLLSDPDVMRYLEPPYSNEQTRAFLMAAMSDHPPVYAVDLNGALMAAVAEDDAGQQAMTETQTEPEQEQPVAGQTTIRVLIKSSGGKVNIRTGNGTSYSRITAVAPGTTLEYVASAFNGWQAVKIGSQVGWVSGEYSEIITE